MKTFKTPKGTELPIQNIKGKDYLTVAYRLVWFREEHPDWTIKTEMIESSETSCVFRAEIYNGSTLVSTGHKEEHKAHFNDHREKGETGAIGRALAHCGYGTQFAPDLHEGERIVDSPIEPKLASPNEKKEIAKTLKANLKDKKVLAGDHEHAWRDSQYPNEFGEDMEYCTVCKMKRNKVPINQIAFDANEKIPF